LRALPRNAPEIGLLAIVIVRLWLMVLPSSLWTDETGTAFIARFPSHPSLAVVPQYTDSIYYALPRAMDRLLGFSEIGYRIPSVLAMGLALFFMARLAARLVHPKAAWFAVFAALAVRNIDYFAVDARPYALGICCAAGALYFLARWFDSAAWKDAAVFLILAALLWRVHEAFWPFYLVIGFFTLMRTRRKESRVSVKQTFVVLAILVIALLPVALRALALFREANLHAFAQPPSLYDLWRVLSPGVRLVTVCGAAAWLSRKLSAPTGRNTRRVTSLALALAWWLLTPLTVFAFSRISGVSLFVPRYLSLSLPGAALTAVIALAGWLPARLWRPAAIVMAVSALIFAGNWHNLWPDHDPEGWREASRYVSGQTEDANTPVLCISPFVEAVPPVWRPDYPLPGFLYANLWAYPFRGKPYLLPFGSSTEAQDYGDALAAGTLSHARRFLIYGDIADAEYWRIRLSARPELRDWHRAARNFGNIRVLVFAAPD